MGKTPGGIAPYHPLPGWGQGFFKNLNLTKEQQAKLADLGKEYGSEVQSGVG